MVMEPVFVRPDPVRSGTFSWIRIGNFFFPDPAKMEEDPYMRIRIHSPVRNIAKKVTGK